DFENPTDVGADNVYNVTVQVTDNGSPNLSDTKAIAVTVTDVAVGSFQFSQATYTTTEGNGTTHLASMTVTRTGGTDAASVTYAPSDGPAPTATAGSDYVAIAPTVLNFAVGVTSISFNVTINEDTTPEPNENLTATLSAPTNGGTLGTPNPATLTIVNDDAPS